MKPLLLAPLLLSLGLLSARADAAALARRVDDATHGLLSVAFTDLAALDAYAGAPGRTPAEIAEARRKLAASYPEGVRVLDAADAAVEGAQPGGVTFLHPAGAEARLMLRDAAGTGPAASVLGMPASTLFGAALADAGWPANAWIVSNRAAIHPAGAAAPDFSFLPRDGTEPAGEFRRTESAGQAAVLYRWARLALGAFVVEREETASPSVPVAATTPTPVATAAAPARLQAVWSGAYMEAGATDTFKMRAEIRHAGERCEVTLHWGTLPVLCLGTVAGDTVEATGPDGVRFSAALLPERDALKGTVQLGPAGKPRSFYLLRLRDLP